MKKTIYQGILSAVIVAAMLTSCGDDSQKEKDAKAKIEASKMELEKVQADEKAKMMQAQMDADWVSFKTANDQKIQNEEMRMAELRKDMNKSSKAMDKAYVKKMDDLEAKITALKLKQAQYTPNSGNWESFKAEFNHDMDEFGKAFKDLTVDNKK